MCFLQTTGVHNPNGNSINLVVFAQLMECRRAHWCHLTNRTELVHTGATWPIRLNMCFLGPTQTQTTNQSVQPLLHSSRQKVPYFTMGVPFPQNCPFPLGDLDPIKFAIPGPAVAHKPNGISIGSAVFAQLTVECPYILQWDAPFLPQNCPFLWGIWTPV